MESSARLNILPILIFVLSACGGGGGGNGGGGGGGGSGGSAVAAASNLPSVLEFKSPDSFTNDRPWSTAGTSVRLTGGVESQYSPHLDCDDAANFASREIMRVKWRSEVTGQQGESGVFIQCFDTGTIFGIGVRTFWSTEPDRVSLEPGLNRIHLSTYEDGRQIGEDVVTIRRTDGVPVEITYQYPADGAVDVPVNRGVQVRFSEPLDQNQLFNDRFVLTNSQGVEVPGTRFYDEVHWVASFAPSATLALGAEYQVTVSRLLVDLGGGGLDEDAVWSFHTGSEHDMAAPKVISQWPGETCDCAPPSTRVVATFDEPLRSGSVTETSLAVVDEFGVPVGGQVTYIGAQIEFAPDEPFVPDVRYQATVAAGSQDSAGNAMSAPVTWTYRVRGSETLGAWQSGAQTPEPVQFAVGVSDGVDVYVWGEVEELDPELCDPADTQCEFRRVVGKGFRYELAGDRWQPIAHEILDYDFDLGADVMVPFPAPRRRSSVVWTGSEIILYGGGQNGQAIQGGGRYDVLTDTWSAMSVGWWRDTQLIFIQELAKHSAVWTGTSMIVWGGWYWDETINRGWVYEPFYDAWSITGPEPAVTESFRLIPDDTAPAARVNHTAIWSGAEMIVWGGQDSSGQALTDGGRYDPGGNTWVPLPIENAPMGGTDTLSAVWSGSQMIVWNGGQTLDPRASSGASLKRYDAVTDRWVSSDSGWEPRFLDYHAFWTGRAMLVVGIEDTVLPELEPTRVVASYLYDPAADQWVVGARQTIGDHGSFAADWVDGTLVVFDGRQVFTFVID